jgi:hypothetical protein
VTVVSAATVRWEGRVTGDEVRGTTFARVAWGYSPIEANGWLAEVAACLDAGVRPATVMPPPSFSRGPRGYDITAVKQYALGFGGMPSEQPAPLDRSAGNLAGWLLDASLGLLPDPVRRFLRTSQYERDCDAEWLRVSGLPGTRLRRRGWWADAISVVGSDGQVLVTGSYIRLTVAASGQVIRWSGKRGQPYVDAATGNPVLWKIGAHHYQRAETAVLFPGQRWLRFPVQGTRPRNGVMTAIDESGTTLLWFRKPGWGPAVEVIVSRDGDVTPEILCMIAIAASWLYHYLRPPTGG